MAMQTYLKDWMEYYGVTSEMIAFKTGMSVKVLDKYVAGETTPTLQAFKTISETIGVSIDNLVGTTPNEMLSALEEQDKMHILEVTSHKSAVRIQNYLTSLEKTCRVIAVVGEEVENFIIQYDGDVIDIIDLYKNARKMKYRDSREKCTDEELRYQDMEVSRL